VRAPDATYVFTSPTDVAGPTFEMLHRQFTATLAGTIITTNLNDFAKDRVLVLTNVSVLALPAATQACEQIRVAVSTQSGLLMDVAIFGDLPIADKPQTLKWDGAVYVLGSGVGNTTVRITTTFDAGVGFNVVNIGIHGIVIPRGNIAAF